MIIVNSKLIYDFITKFPDIKINKVVNSNEQLVSYIN